MNHSAKPHGAFRIFTVHPIPTTRTLILAALLLAARAEAAPARTGLNYRISDPSGERIPAKLTFLTADGKSPAKVAVESESPFWASREGVVYTLPGETVVPVPPGKYVVHVSHGFEWTTAVCPIEVPKEGSALLEATLERVVDTRGYISADLHLHTLTFSGHGDANVDERMITLCAENVEWAVATDHNHVTDYVPYVERLGAQKWIACTPGNEVTTTWIGHFNAFPFDPARPVIDWKITDPRELFREMRSAGAQVIQVNHPRWTGARGAYFRELDLSPITGDSSSPQMSLNFDAFEVLNGNDLHGWAYQPVFGSGDMPPCEFSVRNDWYNLLNQGIFLTAVGNSDSHHVDKVVAGLSRNFIRSSTDDPTKASPPELMAAVRAGALTVSSGIFVEARPAPEGKYDWTSPPPLPSTLVKPGPRGTVELAIRVQAAPWIRADRLVIVSNGEEVSVSKLEPPLGKNVVRYDSVFRHHPARDSWYVAIAIGDEAPVPVAPATNFPLGFTNAIRVDADGDGHFTPLREHARRLVERAVVAGQDCDAALEPESAAFRRQALGSLRGLEAGGVPGESVVEALRSFTRDADASIRAGAAALLAMRSERSALLALLDARARATDPAERTTLDIQLLRAGHLPALDGVRAAYDHSTGLARHGLRRDLLDLVRRRPVRGWEVAGPYPSRAWEEGLATPWPPEPSASPPAGAGGSGSSIAAPSDPVRWRACSTDKASTLNFRDTMDPRENAVAYARARVRTLRPEASALLVESSNGLRVLINGAEVYRQEPRKDADTRLEVVPVTFPAGESAVVVKSAVEKGVWKFVLWVLDPHSAIELGQP